MFVRLVKKKCSVRGCKCTDCFAISRTREVGNTVIICKSCLGKALGAIDEIDPKTRSNIPAVDNTAVPGLFFNAKALGAKEEAPVAPKEAEIEPTDDVLTPVEEETPETEETPVEAEKEFVCPDCGKVFASEKALKSHKRYCKPQEDKE